jgi:hypothetical protein
MPLRLGGLIHQSGDAERRRHSYLAVEYGLV